MGFLVVVFIIVVFLGALAGGKSFGDTIRTGCGCLIFIIIAIFIIGFIGSHK
jgi:hypothetical protein